MERVICYAKDLDAIFDLYGDIYIHDVVPGEKFNNILFSAETNFFAIAFEVNSSELGARYMICPGLNDIEVLEKWDNFKIEHDI